MDFLYSDLFWACLMVGSIFLLIGSLIAWGAREWGAKGKTEKTNA